MAAARTLSLVLPPRVVRWRLTDLLLFIDSVHGPVVGRGPGTEAAGSAAKIKRGRGRGSAAAALRRSVDRLVLLTWAAALPRLARATRDGLRALGLRSTAEWAGTFELVGIDLLVDAQLQVWSHCKHLNIHTHHILQPYPAPTPTR